MLSYREETEKTYSVVKLSYKAETEETYSSVVKLYQKFSDGSKRVSGK